MKRTLCILLSLMLAVTGLVGLGVSASAVAVGEIIEFGNYPQTKVIETTALKNAANAATWISYGYYIGNGKPDGTMAASDYMKYADFVSAGVRYRAVKFTKYRPWDSDDPSNADKSYQDEHGYFINTTYYFRYEPLKWRVLDPSAGLIMCEKIIDSQAYQNVIWYNSNDEEYYNGINSTTYANNYPSSTIRAWLNNDFYNTAFDTTQKNKIKSTTVNNDAYSFYGDSPYNAAPTTDPIFLLSYSEASNNSYGLSSLNARMAESTDYAKCQGIYVYTYKDIGYSNWSLRSAGSESDKANRVSWNGTMVYDYNVNAVREGVRPACIISNSNSLVHTVTAVANPTTGGTVTGSGYYTDGQTATLTATADSGYMFSGWYKDGTKVSSNKSYSFTVTENVTLTAKFTKLAMSYTVTVTADPAAGGTVTGGGSYSEGLTATLTATPNSGYLFFGWYKDGAKIWSNKSFSFTVTESVTLTAKFGEITPVNPTKNAKLNVPQSATVGYKSTVTVTATAEDVPEGYFVALYEGDTQLAKGDNKAVSYTEPKMKEGKTLTAKVIDLNGNVQSNADGKLEKEIKITVKTGFFDKVKAFFQSLFGLLPKVELKP